MTNFIVTKSDEVVRLTQSGEYEVRLTKPGAHVDIKASFLGQNSDQIDIRLIIIHSAPHTSAHTMLKGVGQDKSQIRFFGRIQIDPNCPDTQSFLEERILLLSDNARAEAIPELEILSDDVKCSHAASISKIPAEHLFYLMSRGLTKKQSEDLIVEGFLDISA